MSKPPEAKEPYNLIVRSGMWMTVAGASVWIGGKTYEIIKGYVPWFTGIAVVVLILGLIIQFRRPKPIE